MLQLRPARPDDWPAIWSVLEPTFRRADTYTFAPDISETEARTAWMENPQASTFVACGTQGDARNTVLGTYLLKANQPGQGAHVANCGYVVSDAARGLGVASAMCEHSQREAIARGFRAMQFNFVVSTNEAAVHLWQKLGFAIVGTLPGAFRHPRHGFVDAYVMYKQLQKP